MTTQRKVPTYCYQCVAGPDLLNVVVEDGVAVKVEPNFGVKEHPAGGRVATNMGKLLLELARRSRRRFTALARRLGRGAHPDLLLGTASRVLAGRGKTGV